ncbi:MAG TPA: DUF6766 family protein [Solirubrobacterales bacterium]|nr:DUF6766 family protein [Solirubrobacterales bacterium]
MENWQSEYLQFALFALATVWLPQKGSPESKELDEAGTESDEEQKVGRWAREDSPCWAKAGDLRTTIYPNSLIIVMALVFLGSWFAQSVTGWTEHNQEQHDHGDPRLSWLGYVGSSSSGRRPSKTGNPSSSPSAPSPSSLSTCDSGVRPSQSRSERPLTTRPGKRARRGVHIPSKEFC